jgi:hypothetical protein
MNEIQRKLIKALEEKIELQSRRINQSEEELTQKK